MIKEVIATGKDVAEAKENAIAALAAGEMDDVKYEILHIGSRGIFGIIGVKPAQVRAYIEMPDRQERPRRERPAKRDRDNARSEAVREETTETASETDTPRRRVKVRRSTADAEEIRRTVPRARQPLQRGHPHPRARLFPRQSFILSPSLLRQARICPSTSSRRLSLI